MDTRTPAPPETKTANQIAVNNLCAIGIIFPTAKPSLIFTDIKWQYPVKAFDGMACPQGGNWFGEGAANDPGPLATLRRELEEELSFEKATDDGELGEILDIELPDKLDPRSDRTPTDADKLILAELVKVFQMNIVPFADFYARTPRSVLDAVDPENQRGDMSAVVSSWLIPVLEKDWQKLVRLQVDFGNLSNESRSTITSAARMAKIGLKAAFGHDRILQAFWRAMGIREAENLPMVAGIEHRLISTPRARWTDYLVDFNPAKRPPGF